MFKKYQMKYTMRNHWHTITFYVNAKKCRTGGFYHRAIALGDIPRLDGTKADLARYDANGWKLEKARRCRAEFHIGTEKWEGQACLCKLWKRLAALPFVDMSEIALHCPFAKDAEPDHENIVEADDVFAEGEPQ